MNTVTVLILFSAVGATICARARAAGPALFFSLVAVVALLVATPMGEQLREFSVEIADAARQARTDGAS